MAGRRNTPLVGALPIDRIDAERVFASAYTDLRPRLVGRKNGALIAMLDLDGALEASVWIRGRKNRPRCAIVGRHPHCAVALPWAMELSLRHAAVLVRSVESIEGPKVETQVLDLLSGWGFFSEDGVPLESVTTDGTAFFQIGAHVLAVITTTPDHTWPESAKEAYASIPDREFIDSRTMVIGHVERSVNTQVKQMSGVVRIPMENPARLDASSEETGLMFVNPQELTDDDAPEDEIRREVEASFKRALVGADGPLGELVITADDRHDIVPIGEEALSRGIVLGRYSRCARRGLTPLSNSGLSRVHLLVTLVDDQVLAYDTASANGSWDRNIVANGVELHRGRVVRLATGQAHVSWV